MNYTRKLLNRIKLLLVLFLGLGSVIIYTPNIIKADGGTIVKNLELSDKQDFYYPGSIVYLKGDFTIPNDSEQKVYGAGDTFEISIPKGMEVVKKHILLGDMGSGVYDPDTHKMIFTFNENIEQLMDRDGGFNLQLRVSEPEKEGDHDLPLEFTDENNQTILKDNIHIKNTFDSVVGESFDKFVKNMDVADSGNPIWYMYINKSGELKNETVTLTDNLGPYQIFDMSTFSVSRYRVGTNENPITITQQFDPIVNDDQTVFTLDIFVEDGYYYYIEYETIYTGGFDNPDIYNRDKIKLRNEATLVGESYGPVPMDSNENGNTVDKEYTLDGWLKGKGQWGDFELIKVDSITKEKLPNAVFSLKHHYYETMQYRFETNEDGIATLNEKILDGVYTLSEIEAPKGYKKMEDQEVLVTFTDGKFEMIVENTPLPIEISGRKNWLDINGNETEAQETIIVLLKENGKLIRQSVIKKGDEPTFTFKNLQAKDANGEMIEYTVEEKPLEGFDTNITQISDYEYVITNKEAVKNTKTDVKGKKIWLGVDNKPIDPVKDITVKLYANGQYLKETIVKKDGLQEFVFEDLDVYDSKNKEIKYTIQEEDIEGFTATYLIDKNTDLHEITNKVDTTSVKFEKQWFDENGNSIDAVEDIDVILLANGIKFAKYTLPTTQNSHTFENLPVVDNLGETIEYSVKEVENSNYTAMVEFDEDQDLWILKNYTKPSVTVPESVKTSIKGEKIWLDQHDQIIESQQDIIIELYADNIKIQELTLEKGQSRFKFDNLDMYNTTTRDAIKYHVQEQEVAGFESTVEFENDNWIITNKEVETIPRVTIFEIPFIKVWKDYEGNTISAQQPITVNLYANDDIIDTVTLTPEHKQEYNFVGLVELDENGDPITYRVEEEEVEGYISSVIQDADTGQWIITNQSTEKPVTPPPVEENKKPVRPQEVEKIEKPVSMSPNTGITVSYMPYILLIVASTLFGLLLIKNKKNKQEQSY